MVARDTLRGALDVHPPLVRPQSFPPERGLLGPLGPGDGRRADLLGIRDPHPFAPPPAHCRLAVLLGRASRGLDHFCGEYAIYALQARPDSLPGGEISAWIVSWMWVPFNALLVYVALLYPNGQPPTKRWWPVAWLVGIAAVAAVTVEALLPIPVCNVCSIENPLGIESLESVSELVDPLIEAFWYGALGLVAVTSLYVRFRHAGEVERQQ